MDTALVMNGMMGDVDGVVDGVGGKREAWERGDEAGLLCPAGTVE